MSQEISNTEYHELKKQLLHFQRAVDIAGFGFWEWNLEEDSFIFSDNHYAMLGYKPDEFPSLYDSWFQLVHPDDQKSIIPKILDAIINDRPFEETYRMKCKDGSWKWISSRGKVFEKDSDQKPIRASGIHVDISHIRQADEELFRFKRTIEIINVGMVMMNRKGTIEYVNPYFAKTLGYTVDELKGTDYSRVCCGEDTSTAQSVIQRIIDHRFLSSYEQTHIHRDGFEVSTLCNGLLIRSDRDGAEQIVITALDIRGMKEIQKQLVEDQERLKILIRSMDDIIFVLDQDLVFKEYLLPQSARLYIAPEQFIGKTFLEVGLPPSVTQCVGALRQVLDTGVSTTTDYYIDSSQGREWFNLIVSPLHDVEGKVNGIICAARDITDRKKAEEALREMSIRDSLTGLINRRHLFERLEELIEKHLRKKRNLSVAIIDLDYFKNVNDTIGHLAGDHILKEFAAFLQSRVRKYDLLARYGGEEFLIVFEECKAREAMKMVQRILKDVRSHTFYYKEIPIQLTFSCGIAELEDLSYLPYSVDNLIDLSDKRMYMAKQRGRNQAVFASSI